MILRIFIRFYVTALSSNPDLQVLFNEKNIQTCQRTILTTIAILHQYRVEKHIGFTETLNCTDFQRKSFSGK